MNSEQLLNETALEVTNNRNDKTREVVNGFYDLGIAPNLMKGIDRLKFKIPTPIQKEAIPAGICGKDIIAIARTGSGKTLAFGIPMLQHLSKSKRGTGLVLVPTRELAIQVEESIQSFGRLAHIRSVVLIGGASMSLQRNILKKNPRIIIATPGRLMDHIDRRTVNLSNVEVFVLDEADRMLDMGFVKDIKKIIKAVPNNRQTMLFSATMPKEIEAIADKIMEDPIRIEIDRSGVVPAEVSQEMFFIKNQDKNRLLSFQLKKRSGPVLIFTRTRRMASKLTTKVGKMGFAAAEYHSDRSLGQRRSALDGFKRGKYQVLIATDIAARGIDVSGIELVVNYDMPASSEDYVHRIGRTGRAGKSGHAISFANSDQRGAIRNLERFMKTKLTISRLPFMPLLEAPTPVAKDAKSTNDKKDLRDSKKSSPKNESSRESSPVRRSFKKDDSKGKKPYWSKFKKSWSSKNKSSGKSGKKRGRRK